MDDRRAQGLHELVGLVDVFARPGAKAQMMQADTILVEALATMRFWSLPNGESRPSTHAVVRARDVHHFLHPEKRQKLPVKRARAVEICDGDEGMRDAVDLHGLFLSGALPSASQEGAAQ